MTLAEDKVIGIVGGMGPQAGLSLFNKIITHTKATIDQQHLSVILISFPGHITDRTSFIEGSSEVNPAFNIVKIIKKLESAGANLIGMACNTSHSPEIFGIILSELAKEGSNITLLNMPVETCKYIKKNYALARRIGLMTTNGTYRSKVYENLLHEMGYEVIVPDFEFQNDVIHKIIYDPEFGIKANSNQVTERTKNLMDKSAAFFEREKSDAIILGCTELSLITDGKQTMKGIPIIDSTEALALALIREATKEKRRVIKKHSSLVE